MRLTLACTFVVLLCSACFRCDTPYGTPCSSPRGCAGTLACDGALPGGYCTEACSEAGADTNSTPSQCRQAAEWPDGICAPFGSVGDAGLQCAAKCTSDAGCRAGFRCVGFGAGAGCVP